MTSKEFKIWLEGFLTPLNLDNMDGKKNYSGVNNHLTMLKTIHDKLSNLTAEMLIKTIKEYIYGKVISS